MLGDRPVGSLDSDPNRFAEICRLFFSIVVASRQSPLSFSVDDACALRVNGEQSLSFRFRVGGCLDANAFRLGGGMALFINSKPRRGLSGAGQIPLSACLQGCIRLRGRLIPDHPDWEWAHVSGSQ